MSMILMFITNDTEIASEAENVGIDRIFVDLEIDGKFERQGHRDTLISNHTFDDVSKIRSILYKSELLVRVNPISEKSKQEIDEVISRGADIIMLPMGKTVAEVYRFIDYVQGKAKTCILVETAQALVRLENMLDLGGINEVYIGLNDMHLSLGLTFMFELLSGGIVDYMSGILRRKNVFFGFGGIARIGQGILPAELIIGEHYRLGSQCVILSRTFHNKASNLQQIDFSLKEEINKIRLKEQEINTWTVDEFEKNRKKVRLTVNNVVNGPSIK